MTVGRCRSVAVLVLLTAAVIAAFPRDTFAKNNKDKDSGWTWVREQCVDASTDKCAQAAILQVSRECAQQAVRHRKGSNAWRILGVSFTVLSAGFTGIGASTTISNAKVWSTLGGTTGLGAVSATIAADASQSQSKVAAVHATLESFLKYVQGDGSSRTPNELIYKSAPIYAAQCAAPEIEQTEGGATRSTGTRESNQGTQH